MSKVKVNPRQRFISLMYLVLLAMLALSIPDTVLNAFNNISDNLESGTSRTKKETNNYIAYFEQNRLKNDTAKHMPYYKKAIAAKSIISNLEKSIDSLKLEFINRAGGLDEETQLLKSPENTDITNRFFQKEKNATLLKEKIKAAHNQLMELFPLNERGNLSLKPEISDGLGNTKKLSWEEHNFGPETPATAAIAILSMFHSDAANTENDVIKKLLGRLDETELRFDNYVAVAAAPSSYVLAGEAYTASVYLSSYNSQQSASMRVNNQPIQVVEGIGNYKANTNTPGIYTWRGVITVKQTDGKYKTYTTPVQTYQVAKPAATVAATRMNVVYAGIENPIEIASAGIPDDQISVVVNGAGSLKKVGKGYEYTVGGDAIGKKVVFNVMAKINGKSISVGSQEFRIKRIKDPIAKVAGKSSGSMTAVALRNQSFIYANLDDFEFDIKFNIVRFNLIKISGNREIQTVRNNGADFNAEVKVVLDGASSGNRIIFDNIVAKGPDGKERLLNSILININ